MVEPSERKGRLMYMGKAYPRRNDGVTYEQFDGKEYNFAAEYTRDGN